MNSTPVKKVDVSGVVIGGNPFTVIAGPCAIENPLQFETTVNSVLNSGASLIRGGIWKMRTSAQTFQGLGSGGFSFIREICKKYDVSLTTEITEIEQIEQIHDLVDMYQVGARSMHNTALLKALGKTNKPVLLKRGFAAYIDEWLKAADYIVSGGNDNVILCERGIRTFENATRNTLDLNAVVYAKKYSSFPVIVDPSHAVGMSELVPDLALAAAACGADGLMVEVHPNPKDALSDGRQALTLEEFSSLMFKLEKVLFALDRKLNTRPLPAQAQPLPKESSLK
jgi:3-deoxy-7-phosphoheptulonate synthase